MLTERHNTILEEIIRAYVRTAMPVASQQLVEALPFLVSSATIRNEMAELERGGYLAQPHVSAGRVPTAEAFRLLSAQMLREALSRFTIDSTSRRVGDPDRTAKTLAQEARTISYVAWGRMPSFAGFEFVLTAPEFRDADALASLAFLMDVASVWEQRLRAALSEPMHIFIAEENPLFESRHFSVAAARLPRLGVVALIGPVRMDYRRAIATLSQLFL